MEIKAPTSVLNHLKINVFAWFRGAVNTADNTKIATTAKNQTVRWTSDLDRFQPKVLYVTKSIARELQGSFFTAVELPGLTSKGW